MSTRRETSFHRRRAQAVGSALALGSLLVSGASRAQEQAASDSGAPAPTATPAATAAAAHAPSHIETSPRIGLIIGGAITLGIAYLYSAGAAGAQGGDPARSWLYVPVAGPFLFVHNRARCPGNDPTMCVDDWATPVVFTTFGVVQALGATLIASGFLFPRERVVSGASAVTWAVTPSVVGQSGLGVAAAGTLF